MQTSVDAYEVISRERLQADADSRRTLIELLLSGRLTELEWTRWIGSLGHDGRTTPFHFVVLHWWSEDEVLVVDAAARTAQAVSARLRAATGHHPIDVVRGHEVLLLIPAEHMSSRRMREELSRAAATRPHPKLQMSGAISPPARGTQGLIAAYNQATRVARVARSTGSIDLVEEVGLFDHAVSALRPDFAEVCRPEIASFIRACLSDPRDVWLPTISAWSQTDMNVAKTAARLHVHRNTVYYRLTQIAQATGVDPQTVIGLADLLVAVRLKEELSGT